MGLLRVILIGLISLLFASSLFAAGGCQTGWTTGTECTVTSDGTVLSCAQADAVAAIAQVSAGDIVTLKSSCTATYPDTLNITKAITLKGGGSTSTVITTTNATTGIQYNPATPSESNRFRLTALGIIHNNAAPYSRPIYLVNASTTKEYVRIDHCSISETAGYYTIGIAGTIFGAIDHNIITTSSGDRMFDLTGWTSSTYTATNDSWANLPRVFGTKDNLYIEDNVLTTDTAINVSGGAGRYVFRYDTITAGGFGVFDMHGNQNPRVEATGGTAGSMIAEVYGNDLSGVTSRINDVRGGKSLHFYNKIVTSADGTASIQLREEFTDEASPGYAYGQQITDSYIWSNWQTKAGPTTNLIVPDLSTENCCITTGDWAANTLYGDGVNYYCQKFTNDSNHNCWKIPGTGIAAGFADPAVAFVSPYKTHATTEPDWESTPVGHAVQDGGTVWYNMGSADHPLVENADFFIQKTGTFDGTGVTGGGVGCGAVGSKPATCKAGVGYWETAQSCSDLSTLVGASTDVVGGTRDPSIQITGTLYKCGPDNTWTAYYQPYTYPYYSDTATYFDLTVTAPTNGTITTADGFINCGTGGVLCSYTYASTDSAVISFTPDSGYRTVNSSGSCSGASGPQTIAMSEARTCAATFEKGMVLGSGNTLTLGTGNTITLQ